MSNFTITGEPASAPDPTTGTDSECTTAVATMPDPAVDTRPLDAATRQPAHGARTLPAAKLALMAADVLALLVGLFAAFVMQAVWRPIPTEAVVDELLLSLVAFPAFAIGAVANQLYLARANSRPVDEIRNILKSVAIMTATILAAATFTQYKDISRLWLIGTAIGVSAALIVERGVARRTFDGLRARSRMLRRIVIVGTDPHAVGMLHRYSRNPGLGYDVVGFVGDDDLGVRDGVSVLGPLDDVERVLEETDAVGVVVSLQSVEPDYVNRLTRRLTDAGYHVALSSSLNGISIARIRPQELDGQTMLYVEPTIRTGWRATAKRAYDLAFALSLALVTVPLLAIAAIAIKLDSRGPVLFAQLRVGKDGKLFRMYKLRTMVTNAEELKADLASRNESNGPLFKIKRDPRITRVGRVLRKLSIDELPQLYCVLAGTMSMVGPRPALPDEVAQWADEVAERLRVPPGITGLWQVSGRSNNSFDDYKRMDFYYVDNWTLTHDVYICLLTVKAVFFGTGD